MDAKISLPELKIIANELTSGSKANLMVSVHEFKKKNQLY